MQNLFAFLVRHGVLLLFLGLEVLCFKLVVGNNHRQAEIYHNSSTIITGALNKQVSGIVNYWNLQGVNDSLRIENATLRERLFNNIVLAEDNSSGLDSMVLRYGIGPAMVVQNSIGLRNNYITLDHGYSIGIEPGMGVVTAEGPVGIVVASTKRFARVMSLLHSNTMLSASIKSKGYFGSLVWRSANPKLMELDALPKHAQIQVGDTVVTSGYSKIFPPGLQIGRIDTFWLPHGSNFYRASVLLDVDLSSLHTAYVILNYSLKERESLEFIDRDE
jgi:rod shape-determining protein MreC